MGANKSLPAQGALAHLVLQSPSAFQWKAKAANAPVTTLLLLLLLWRLLLLQQSHPVCLRAGTDAQPPPPLSFHLHPSIYSPRVQRALLCARPWAGHREPNPRSRRPGTPPSLPPAPGGYGWGLSPPKASESPSPESRKEAQPEAAGLGRPGARVSEAARRPSPGAQVAPAPPLPLPSSRPPLSSEGRVGCYARGRRGYEGFESAQAAEWSSRLFPPPATGLNFCTFELNGAFFCCLPEGACSAPRALLGRERPPGAQLGASQRAGPEPVRASRRRQGGGCGGAGDQRPGDLGSGSQAPDRAPPQPLPGQRCSPRPRAAGLSSTPTELGEGSCVLKGARATL